ncbi:MAG: hypothetical protein QXL15_00445 [Candidatus Korarchaeota archaeon]
MDPVVVFLFTIIAAVLFNVAVFLEKIGVDRMPKITENFSLALVAKFFTNIPWVIGILTSLTGGIFYMTAMAEGNLSLIQVVANWGIIVLVILSVKYIGERLSYLELVGILISLVGISLVALTFETNVLTSFDWWVFWATIGISAGFSTGMYLYGLSGKKGAEVGFGVAAGSMFSIGAISTKALTVVVVEKVGEFNLFSQLTWSAIGYPDVIVVLILVLLSNLIGFVWLQIGIQAGRATIVASVNGVMAGIIPIIGGVVVFGESLLASGLPGLLQYLRLFGIVLTVSGTSILYIFNAKVEEKMKKKTGLQKNTE